MYRTQQSLNTFQRFPRPKNKISRIEFLCGKTMEFFGGKNGSGKVLI